MGSNSSGKTKCGSLTNLFCTLFTLGKITTELENNPQFKLGPFEKKIAQSSHQDC